MFVYRPFRFSLSLPKACSQARDLITLLTNAIAMALQFNHEVNHSRRVAMKKELHKDYAALCNSSTVEGS